MALEDIIREVVRDAVREALEEADLKPVPPPVMALAGSPRRCSPKLPTGDASGGRQVSYAA